MNTRVMFVDDEPMILDGIRRQLRSAFDITLANSGDEALQIIADSEPFPVIVSDMRMPGMSGAEFLKAVREQSPDSIRMILSGQSDLEDAIDAVNDGQIFRFLTKPCPPDTLREVITDGIRQHELIHVEKVLLENTLSGAVQIMSELLSITAEQAWRRSERIGELSGHIASHIGIADDWAFKIASMLSQIGCAALSESAVTQLEEGQALDSEALSLYETHAKVAGQLLRNIPRLEPVAEMIERQSLSSAGSPASSQVIAQAGDIFRCAATIDHQMQGGRPLAVAVEHCLKAEAKLDAGVASAVTAIANIEQQWAAWQVAMEDLEPGMVLAQDIVTPGGTCLLPKGVKLKTMHVARLQSAGESVGLSGPVSVLSQHVRPEAAA